MSYPYQYTENQSTPSTPYAQSPWEIEQNQELFHQQHAQPQTFEHPTIQLPEPERIVPSQHHEQHDNQPIPLHSVHSHEGRSDRDAGDVKPRIHVNTTRPSTSPAETGISMPMRHSPMRPHLQLASHPYQRPRSAAGGAIMRHRRDQEQHVRFAGQAAGPPFPTQSVSAPARMMTSFGPTLPTVSSPTGSHGLSSAPKAQVRRFIIRADVHYDAESKMITAMLELPGVKKSELSIKLSTCVYNRVRQVTICGRSKPVFPEVGLAVRERKFGDFVRTFAVPPDTTAKDIEADMQDGILMLKISCHVSPETDEPQEIAIR